MQVNKKRFGNMEILHTQELSPEQAKKLIHDILMTQPPESKEDALEMIKQIFMVNDESKR
jgi:hypothetical protein